jgi:hypothetical protein
VRSCDEKATGGRPGDRIAGLPVAFVAHPGFEPEENMGIYSSMRSSVDLDAIGVNATSQAYGWRDKMAEGGLKEALAWRDGPYQDYRAAPQRTGPDSV